MVAHKHILLVYDFVLSNMNTLQKCVHENRQITKTSNATI